MVSTLRLRSYSFPISLLLHLTVFAVVFWMQQNFGNRDFSKSLRTPAPMIIEVPPLAKTHDPSRQKIVQSEAGRKAEVAAPDSYLGKETRVVDQEKSAQESIARRTAVAKAVAKTEVAQGKKEAQVVPLSKLGVGIIPKAELGASKAERAETENYVDPREDFGATNEDYVKGLKQGQRSALNTREFVFFGYFQRIREQLDRAWKPILKEQLLRLYRLGRYPSSDRDHLTKTLVTLSNKGEVLKVQVMSESGTHDLDEAAVRAFNQAGPFPNPPRGLVEKIGTISVQWDFVLRT